MASRDYKWYRLDNAATIVPATARGSDTRVFRVTCELTEDVDGEYLQDALDEAMMEFPYFKVVLRKGFFWYYLDSTDMRPKVTEEDLPACSPLYFSGFFCASLSSSASKILKWTAAPFPAKKTRTRRRSRACR